MTILGYYVKEYETDRDFHLSMALPCHIRDVPLLEKYCLPSISRLDPKPDSVIISLNDGHELGLKGIRLDLFDKAFNEYGADVIFSYGVDAIFRKHIMRFARTDMIVAVEWLPLRPFTIITRSIVNFSRGRGWSGSYFLPRDIWYNFCRKKFGGRDSDVLQVVSPEMKRGTQAYYQWIKVPQIYQVRLNRSAYIDKIKNGWDGQHYTKVQKILKLIQVFDF